MIFTNCSKDEQTVQEAELNETYNSSMNENMTMLNSIALGLLEVVKEKEFREVVHTEVEKQFDNDFNVLLKTLQSKKDIISLIEANLKNLNLEQINGNKFLIEKPEYNYSFYSDKLNVEKAVNGFSILDETWYSQIYIPFFETVGLNEEPTIVVSDLDQGDCSLIGYKLMDDGTINMFEVDEDYAKSNLVWVISVNESVNNLGELAINKEERDITNNQRNSEIFVTTTKVKVSDKKECWACGKADIRFKYANINITSSGGCSNTIDKESPEICKIDNNDLNTWVSGIWNVNISNGATDYIDPGEHVLLILFEYDKRTGLKEKIFNPCFHSYYYRSNEDYYIAIEVNQLVYSDFTNPSSNWSYIERSEGNEHIEFRYKN
jgi:hypothetical protein